MTYSAAENSPAAGKVSAAGGGVKTRSARDPDPNACRQVSLRELKTNETTPEERLIMAVSRVPAPPKGTGPSGRALWRDVLGKYSLEEHELALLRESCRTVDQLDALAAAVAADGAMVSGRVHPALVESRQLRIALARLVGALRLPAGDEDDQVSGRRPQRRVGVRGVYAMGGRQ